MRTGARLVAGMVVTVLAVATAAAAGAAARADETLRLLRIDNAPTGASVDVAVPFSQAGRTLPLSAFEVTLGDEPATITADRLVDQPIVMDLVVELPADTTQQAELRGALVEFVQQLEPGVRLRVVGASSVDVGQDREAALDAVRDLQPVPSGTTGPLLAQVLGTELASGSAPAGAVRVAVVAASASPVELLTAAAPALVEGTDYAPDVRNRFRALIDARPSSVITAGSETSTTANTTTDQLATFDTIARDLRSTYRLTVPGAEPGQNIAVQMTTDAGPTRVAGSVPSASGASPTGEVAPPTAAAETTAPTDATTAERPGEELAAVDDGTDVDPATRIPWWMVAIVGVVLVGGLGFLLVRRLARRRARRPVAEPDVPLLPVAATPPPTPVPELVAAPEVITTPRPAAAPAVVPAEPPAVVPAVPPPFDPSTMVGFEPAPIPDDTATPMFSHEPEPQPSASPLFDRHEIAPPPVPEVFSRTINLTTDIRISRATTRAERALASLRAAHDARPLPPSQSLTVAIEAAASGWLENHEITADEVVRLLDAESGRAHPVSRAYAEGLVDLLEGPDRTVWDLALVLAERLGHAPAPRRRDHYGEPAGAGTLVEQVAAVVAITDSDFVGRLGGIVGRGLLASWPARAGRLDQVPLIVSPSLAAAADGLGGTGVDPTDLIVGLLAVMEDAAMRMMRSEQGVADLRQHYLSEIGQPAVPERGKLSGKEARWVLEPPSDSDGVRSRIVELLFSTPVLSASSAAERLAIAPERATTELAGLTARGWLRPLDGPPATRWMAPDVIARATRPFAPEYSPIDPTSIDLTVTTPRSVHHAHT